MTVTQFDHVRPWTQEECVQPAEGKPGHSLVLTEPVAVEIDPAALGPA